MAATPRRSGMPGKSRRELISRLGAVSAACTAHGPAAAQPDSRTLIADVLVIGGGTAGSVAAVQAARLGAKTILIEAGSQLGGTVSTAGVDFPGLFHAWGRQIIAGIGWDLVRETLALGGGSMPDFSQPYGTEHWRHQIRINGALYAVLAEEACVKAGVGLRYYETPLSIKAAGDSWIVHTAGKGMSVQILARQLIDCTGDASAAALIGLGRLREPVTQPGSLIYRLGGYDLSAIDMPALEAAAREALAAGRLISTDYRHSLRGFLASGGENATHLPGADSSNSERHSRTNIDGRQSLLRIFRFLKAQPGFHALRLERLQPEAGVRETYRIVGETSVTVADYTSGRIFEDAIAYSFYPIDLHDERGIRPRPLAKSTVATIPLGALIPKSSRNVIAAGRSISSDRLANSALRVQASCMAMGQAAGAAAALAAKLCCTPAAVPLARVRDTLRAHGAIVPV